MELEVIYTLPKEELGGRFLDSLHLSFPLYLILNNLLLMVV